MGLKTLLPHYFISILSYLHYFPPIWFMIGYCWIYAAIVPCNGYVFSFPCSIYICLFVIIMSDTNSTILEVYV